MRYFQIAKCFRDEDLRADRQPEFTQVDIEMSFVQEDDVMNMAEKLIAHIFKEVKNIDITLPLQRMKYDDAIKYYGSDKPDLRYDMKINDITNIFKETSVEFIANSIKNGGIVNAIIVKNSADKYSRKDIDKLTLYVKNYKASGLAFLKYEDELTGSIAKVLSDAEKNSIIFELNLEKNDLLLIVTDKEKIVKTALGALRIKIAHDLGLVNNNEYKMLWVTYFPSFEWSDE